MYEGVSNSKRCLVANVKITGLLRKFTLARLHPVAQREFFPRPAAPRIRTASLKRSMDMSQEEPPERKRIRELEALLLTMEGDKRKAEEEKRKAEEEKRATEQRAVLAEEALLREREVKRTTGKFGSVVHLV